MVDAALPSLPFPDHALDTVVLFPVFCSVGDAAALAATVAEVRRVLAPRRRVLLIEHVAAPDGTAAAARQRRWEAPLWVLGGPGGGCSLRQQTMAALPGGGG